MASTFDSEQPIEEAPATGENFDTSEATTARRVEGVVRKVHRTG